MESFIEDFRSLHQICDEVYGNMLVAITEAVNNAIIHGNQTDQQNRLPYICNAAETWLLCTVQDQGGGLISITYQTPPHPRIWKRKVVGEFS